MDIKYLYRQIIIDHHRNPQNKGLVENERYVKERFYNSSCGDDITIQILVEDNYIKDIRQDGQGCNICCSSASVMSLALKDKQIKEVREIAQSFYNMLMNKPFDKDIMSGEMFAYSGVKDFPARINCATLPWKALEEALNKIEEK